MELKQAAEDATVDRRTAQKELWTLFQNKQDYSKKKAWQSQIFIPKISMVVEQATSIVKRAVISTHKLFKMESDFEGIDDIEDDYKRVIDDSNFADAFSESVKTSFLLGFGVIKCLWEGGLSYQNIDIANLFVDPDWVPNADERPKYFIECKEMDWAKLLSMAKEINALAGKEIYDIKVIKGLAEDFKDADEDARRQSRLDLNDYSRPDRRVRLLEYWGDIITGDKIEENQLIVIANDKYIIRQQDNPFDHGLSPYIPLVPIVYPHRGSCGVSLVEPVVRLQYAYNNIMNLAIDNLNFSVNKVFEFNAANISNPRSLTQLYPGKMIAKTGVQRALEEVKTSNIGQDVFAMLNLIKDEIEKGTAVTEFLMGSTGKTKTATEAELKTSQAQGLFNTIARDLETNSIRPALKMGYDLLVQFAGAPDIDVNFKVGGLSLLLVHREQVQRTTEILGMALKSDTLAGLTDVKVLWQKLLNLYDCEDAYAPNQPLRPDQKIQLNEAGAKRAREEVSKMSPEEIMQKAKELGV